VQWTKIANRHLLALVKWAVCVLNLLWLYLYIMYRS